MNATHPVCEVTDSALEPKWKTREKSNQKKCTYLRCYPFKAAVETASGREDKAEETRIEQRGRRK